MSEDIPLLETTQKLGISPLGPKDGLKDEETQNNSKSSEGRGLSLAWTVTFILGETIGAGSLVLPRALSYTGWGGLPLILLCIGGTAYSAVLLARCWVLIQERYPECSLARNPFPLIGEKAIGAWMRVITSIINNTMLFTTCTVLVLLSSQNVQSLLAQAGVHFSFCYCVLVMAAILTPVTWLGTPKDFRFAALIGILTIWSALGITVVLAVRDTYREPPPPRDLPSPLTFVLVFGILLFSYGTTATFPTIQQDMRDPSKFSSAIFISAAVIIATYTAFAGVCYGAYGSDVRANVIMSLPRGVARSVAEALVTVHLLAAFIIVFNPVSLGLESIKFFNVPPEFTWRRCVVRTWLMLMLAFLALSLPNFGALVSFIGGSLVCFSALVAPPIFYWNMCTASGPWQPLELPTRMKVTCILLVLFGVFGGVMATYSSLLELLSSSTLVPPCYVNITAASLAQAQ